MALRRSGITCALALFAMFRAAAPTAGQPIVFVDVDATGPTHDGSSWCQAFDDLQSALTLAANSGGEVSEIRIANGVYRPAGVNGSRNATFQLASGLAILGGFAGCGADDPDERNIAAHEVIFSGDLNSDDVGDFNDPSRNENVYHVMTGSDVNATALLDGVTVTAGNADNFTPTVNTADKGGGLYVLEGSPTLERCTFVENRSVWGGAVFIEESDLAFTDCLFVNNFALRRGGAFNNRRSDLALTDCIFLDNFTRSPNLDDPNRAWGNGGAIYNFRVEMNMIRCDFSGNLADGHGDSGTNQPFDGNGGCVFNQFSGGVYTNCRFVENFAEAYGAGVHNQNESDPFIIDCLFKDNLCTAFFWWEGAGAGINCWSSTPTLINCHMEGQIADHGGCYHGHGSATTFINCTLVDNHALMDPGGAVQVHDSTPAFINCSIVGNTGPLGGGVYLRESEALFANCLIMGNTASTAGGGVYEHVASGSNFVNCTIVGNASNGAGGGVWHGSNGSTTFENSILWGNTATQGTEQDAQITFLGTGVLTMSHNVVQGWDGTHGGVGNMGDDPLLSNIAGGDARLTAGSPAINAGDPKYLPDAGETDLDGHARILCERLDMGAYEFGIGDAECDQDVDIDDFAAWTGCFTGPENGPLSAGCEVFDFDGDLDVDHADFAGFQRAFTGP